MNHSSRAMTLGGLGLLAFPIAFVVGDLIRMGTHSDDGDSEVEVLRSVAAHQGVFEVVGWVGLLLIVAAIAATLVIWRLALDRAPGWAWASGVFGAMLVIGSTVHLQGYVLGNLMVVQSGVDLDQAAQVVSPDSAPLLGTAVFAPYLLGLMLGPIVWAISLFRAKVIALPSLVAAILAQILITVVGSTMWATPVWAVLFLIGFAPAALVALRGSPESAEAHSPGVTIPVS